MLLTGDSFDAACTFQVYREASVVQWLSYLPCKSGVVSSIPGFSSLSDETLNQGPIAV